MRVEPILATSKTAARLLDVSEAEFLALVNGGQLPKPVDLAGMKRWSVENLRRIARGAAADGMEDIDW